MIRLLIVDDHPMVREGLRAFLARTPGLAVVGEAGSAEEAVPLVDRERPDVVIMDLVLPGAAGADAVRLVTSRERAPRVLVLTSFADPGRAADALAAGATGYLVKTVAPDDLVVAIQQAARGRGVWDTPPQGSSAHPPGGPLTPRETEVLRLLGRGCDNREIARRLGISVKTVKTHTGRIYDKLMVSDRTEAVVVAAGLGLIALGRQAD